MQDDLISTFTPSRHALVSFSIGYFIYDALGMAVSTRQYVAYGGLSLMVEVNSVFLHTRQLFIITGEPKSSSRYRTNSLLNVATFLFFRILILFCRILSVDFSEIFRRGEGKDKKEEGMMVNGS